MSSPLQGSPVCHSPTEGQEGGVGTGLCSQCCRMAPSSCRFVSVAALCNAERPEGTGQCRIHWCRENPCPGKEKREKTEGKRVGMHVRRFSWVLSVPVWLMGGEKQPRKVHVLFQATNDARR